MRAWPFDWDYPRVLLVALSAVTLVALIVVASTSATAFGVFNPAWDGASELRSLASETGADPVVARNLEPYRSVDPNETVAVVLAPTEPYTAREATELSRFLRRGGTLVVADDFGRNGNRLLRQLGADSRIDGTLLRDEQNFYRDPAIPRATNVTNHPLTAGVDQLTLNRGSAIEPNGATVLVRTSGFAYADENRNGELDAAEALGTYPVVTVESHGAGRLVVAGDPSAFINVMLEQPGNQAFVSNLFGRQSVVLLDYSHVGGFPPLSFAILVLRDTAVLQLLVGVGGIAAIGLWTRDRVSIPSFGRRDGAKQFEQPRLSEEQLVAYVERQHPEWDDERTRRVVRGVLNQRTEPDADE